MPSITSEKLSLNCKAQCPWEEGKVVDWCKGNSGVWATGSKRRREEGHYLSAFVWDVKTTTSEKMDGSVCQRFNKTQHFEWLGSSVYLKLSRLWNVSEPQREKKKKQLNALITDWRQNTINNTKYRLHVTCCWCFSLCITSEKGQTEASKI